MPPLLNLYFAAAIAVSAMACNEKPVRIRNGFPFAVLAA